MRRKKRKPHIEVKCDYCGSMTDRFVVNMEHKRFCRHQYVGFPPEKDCMDDYIKEKKNRAKEAHDTVLLFCWDTDSYRLLMPKNVTSIVPLNRIIKND